MSFIVAWGDGCILRKTNSPNRPTVGRLERGVLRTTATDFPLPRGATSFASLLHPNLMAEHRTRHAYRPQQPLAGISVRCGAYAPSCATCSAGSAVH